MCVENFVTKVCLRDHDFRNLPPATQRLLGNLQELKGKQQSMGKAGDHAIMTGNSRENVVMTLM